MSNFTSPAPSDVARASRPDAQTKHALSDVWAHIDGIYPESGNLLSRAADSVAEVRVVLLSGKPFDRHIMAGLLDGAHGGIVRARGHLDDAIEALGDYSL